MDIFDKIGKTASQAYKVTAEKTTKLTKEAKLKLKNSENKSAIDDLYKEIGKKVYEKHVRDEKLDIKRDLEEECTKIDILAAEIEANLNECIELKDKVKCKKCTTLVNKDYNFCPACGTKIKTEGTAEVIENEEDNKKARKAKKVEIVTEKDKVEKKSDRKTKNTAKEK